MNKKKFTRKEFLKISGTAVAGTLFGSPLSMLLESVLKGSLTSAYADGAPSPRKWVDFRFDNAPPRFVYDLFLQNQKSDKAKFVANGNHIFTKFVELNGRYVSGVYETVEMKALGKSSREICAPHLWNQNVPASAGGVRPMADLLAHFLNIRGIDTGNPAHEGSRTLHYLPLGAQQSLTALSADGSSTPFAAVSYAVGDYAYRSLRATSPYPVGGTNLVNSLLAPFDPNFPVSVTRANEAKVKDYLEAARNGLKADALARNQQVEAAYKAIDGARELLGASVTDLKTQWAPLLAKYSDLIARSLTTPIPGINDKPVGVAPADRKPGTVPGGGAYDIVGVPVLNDDLNSIFNGAQITTMAEAFAISEFILLNNLSNSITVRIGEFTNLSVISKMGGTATASGSAFDEHTTGGMVSTLLNAVHSLAHSACLLELIDRLVAAGQWQNTVINCSGEFNRKPRNSGTGSDHQYNGASLALYSGIIDGPYVLGDIAADPEPTSYKGTNGAGVVQAGPALDNEKIDIASAAATIAQLLGVRSPVTARETMLLVRGDGIIPRVPPGKIVTGM